jgi:hypothetical protein
MDQLKLVLEHKFWILAGLALLLPPIGWYAATDNLATVTAGRFKKIGEDEKRVNDLKAECPNEKWIAGAQEIDRELTNSVVQSQERLYDHQKPAFTLPPVVKQALEKCKLTYRHEGTMSDDFLNARILFVESYNDEWKSVVRLVKPFNMTTGEGLVVLPDEQTQEGGMTRHGEVDGWRQSLGFTAGQMWEVQEDVWFLRALMEAVARVNEGTTELGNSRVKKIIEATLRGGDLTDLKARQAGNTGAKPGSTPSATPTRTNVGLHLSSAGATGSESAFKPPKAFDANDVFGDDGSQGNANMDTKGRKFDMAAGPVEVKRWFEVTQKWKTRGFVLKLVMDEREIPTLLTSLTQSPFPVEILHVEHTAHTGGAGSDLSRANPSTNQPPGTENVQPTREQQELQKKVHDTLKIAFNVHYLADVIVAGKFTIYLEPPRSRTRAAAASGSTAAAAPRPASAIGTGNAKAADSTGGSGKTVPRATAKSVTTPATPLAKSAPSPSKKGSPPTAAPPAKPGASTPAASPVPITTTNPVPTKSGLSGK